MATARPFLLETVVLWFMAMGCGPQQVVPDPPKDCAPVRMTDAPELAPLEYNDITHWVKKRGGRPRAPVMTWAEVLTLNRKSAGMRLGFQDVLGPAVVDTERVARDLSERAEWLQKRVSSGEYIESDNGSFETAMTIASDSTPVDEVRVVHREARLGCMPMDAALYKRPIDPAFDRNRCSELHAGELIRVIRKWSSSSSGERKTWLYAHTGHSVGWLRAEFVTPPLTPAEAARFQNSESRLVATQDGPTMRLGRSAPLLSETEQSFEILWPSNTGLKTRTVPKAEPVRRGYPELIPSAIIATAFSQLGQPYGWGGHGGHRDCSRFVMDVLGSFGVRLPRFSGYQAKAGTRTVNVSGMSDDEKRRAIVDAGETGIVLLYMRGHIMLYLGDTKDGLWAISSISEYRRACGSQSSQTVHLNRIAVTDLEVGRDTDRQAFIERIHTLAVFGS